MISDSEKLECVKWAKSLSIKHQKFEAAASLRDTEKQIAEQLHLVDYKVSYGRDLVIDNFNLDQLKYAQSLLEKYFSQEESQLISEIIQLRRNNNISNLLD